jgi:hypothetical protein
MASWNVSNTFIVAGTNYKLYSAIFRKNRSLNDFNIVYFSEIKWFPKHFVTTTYLDASMDIRQTATYFESACGSWVGVYTAEYVLVTAEMTNSIFTR